MPLECAQILEITSGSELLQGSFVIGAEYDFDMDAGTLHKLSAREIDEQLLQFVAAECAVNQSVLELIWAKKVSETYEKDGATSMAAWLSLKLGWSNQRAGKVVRVADALAGLPLIRDAYAQGRLCWERVEALCCHASPETEEELLETALVLGATDLRQMLRSLKPVEVLRGVGVRHRPRPPGEQRSARAQR